MPLATLLLLTPNADVDDDKVVAALDVGPDVRVLVRQPDLPPTGRKSVPRAAPELFTVACELRHDEPDAAVAAFDGVAGRLEGLIDPARSAALAGVDNELLVAPDPDPGTAPGVLIYGMRRLPNLSHQQFIDYWIGTHADFGRVALAGHGYRQVHADAARSGAVAAAAGVRIDDFDGCVVSANRSWAVRDADQQTAEKQAAGSAALADEDNFIDHDRSLTMRYLVSPPA